MPGPSARRGSGPTAPIGSARGGVVALGVNVDDPGDHRPGQAAAAEAGAVFPLLDTGFTKPTVRSASKTLGMRTWNKPAAACLASRLPYATPVTFGRPDRVGRAEAALHRLGLDEVRRRDGGDTAPVEVPLDRLGPRSGNLNADLALGR